MVYALDCCGLSEQLRTLPEMPEILQSQWRLDVEFVATILRQLRIAAERNRTAKQLREIHSGSGPERRPSEERLTR